MASSLNPVGITVGILYLALVVGFAGWMTGVGPARASSRVNKEWIHRNCIIVPLTDSPTSDQTLNLACRLASGRHAHLILAYVIQVPMTLGLDVPLQAAEEHGRLVLQDGARIAAQLDVVAEMRLIHHRTRSQAILELAQESGAETIVIDAGPLPWWSPARLDGNTELLHCAPCQVVVAKASLANS